MMTETKAVPVDTTSTSGPVAYPACILSIAYFKGCKQKVIRLQSGITMIKGETEAGKTTIVNALEWLFFCPPRTDVEHVLQDGKASGRTSLVALEWYGAGGEGDVLYMNRTKEPGRRSVFYIIHNGVRIEGAPAEAFINNRMGIHDVWCLTSYQAQESLSDLLTAPKAEVLKYFNHLTFQGGDVEPTQKIAAITDEQQKAVAEYTAAQRAFEVGEKLLLGEQQAKQLSGQYMLTPEQYKDKQMQLLAASARLDELKKIQVEASRIKGNKDALESMLRSYSSATAPTVDISTSIAALEAEITTSLSYASDMKKYNDYKSILDSYNTLKSRFADITMTESEMADTLKITGAYISTLTHYRSLQSQLTYAYNALNAYTLPVNNISLSIQEIDTKLLLEDPWKRKQQLDQAEIDLKKVEGPDITAKDISDAQLSRKIRKCPECKAPVRIINEDIVPSKTEPMSDQQFTTLQQQFSMSQQRLSIQTYINGVKASIAHVKPADLEGLTPQVFTDLRKVRAQLIEHADAVRKYETLKNNVQNIKNQIDGVLKQYPEFSTLTVQPQELSTKLTKAEERRTLEQRVKDMDAVLAKTATPTQPITKPREAYIIRSDIDRLRKQDSDYKMRLDLEAKIAALPVCSAVDLNEIQKLEYERDMIPQHLAMSDKCSDWYARYMQHQSSRTKLQELYKEFQEWDELRRLAYQAQFLAISETVSDINAATSEILSDIFTDPITMTFNTTKDTKTGDTVDDINLSINLKGREVKNIRKDISGGARQRISLALTTSLSRLSGFPLLILDESTSGLDASFKKTCMKVISQYTQGKIVLVVAHDVSNTGYDHVITLKKDSDEVLYGQ